jgi:hypothetical protein
VFDHSTTRVCGPGVGAMVGDDSGGLKEGSASGVNVGGGVEL